MTRSSVLADALNAINNAEKTGKRQVLLRPSSKVIIKFLQVMQKHGYIGEFEYIDDHRSGKIVVQLNGRLNKCGVISQDLTLRLVTLKNGLPTCCQPDNSVTSS
ncbi:ANM_HP_G0211390.mRNA.1.CDS.1 [Saccharomyces cerevisiae]|nr:ANM_HP_G0118190.mRNA.1.CDS.1 [Saccharomyces cerevisiae]CAI5087480.1 ANM_HP_G0211390.mRNA.1.CDS.1 [Saccharomyces cerevisiae]CAI6535746.1 ANM_HP_G0118190.mRNA.1.CDS.1 [Saccharomyces cerevisiae]CAI6971225.1 ANM_HP_G0211390.mRNA.1.CDS.1 [Saccharomyces cerevisiae]